MPQLFDDPELRKRLTPPPPGTGGQQAGGDFGPIRGAGLIPPSGVKPANFPSSMGVKDSYPPVGSIPPPPPANTSAAFRTPDNKWQWDPSSGQYQYAPSMQVARRNITNTPPINPGGSDFGSIKGVGLGVPTDSNSRPGFGGPNANPIPAGIPANAQPGSLWHQRRDGTWVLGPPKNPGRPIFTIPNQAPEQPAAIPPPDPPDPTDPNNQNSPLSVFVGDYLNRGITAIDPDLQKPLTPPNYNTAVTPFTPAQIINPSRAEYARATLPTAKNFEFNPDQNLVGRTDYDVADLLGLTQYSPDDLPENEQFTFSPDSTLTARTGYDALGINPFGYERFASGNLTENTPDYNFSGRDIFANQTDQGVEHTIGKGLAGNLGLDEGLKKRLGDIAELNLREQYEGSPLNPDGVLERILQEAQARGLSQSGFAANERIKALTQMSNDIARARTDIDVQDALRRLENQQAAIGQGTARGQLSTQRGQLGEESLQAQATINDALKSAALGRLTGAYTTNLAGQQQAFGQQAEAASNARSDAALNEALSSGAFERQRQVPLTQAQLFSDFLNNALASSGERRAQTGLTEALQQGAVNRRTQAATTEDALKNAAFERSRAVPLTQAQLQNSFINDALGLSAEGRNQASTEQNILNDLFNQNLGAASNTRADTGLVDQLLGSATGRQRFGFQDSLTAQDQGLRNTLAAAGFNEGQIKQALDALLSLSGEDRANALANAQINGQNMNQMLALLGLSSGQSTDLIRTLLGGSQGYLNQANQANQQGGQVSSQPGFWSNFLNSLIGGGGAAGLAKSAASIF